MSEIDWSEEIAKAKKRKTVRTTGRPSVIGHQPMTKTQVEDPYTDKTASIGTAMKAGTIEDPQSQMAFYAKQRFPNDPNAVKRYGLYNGDVVYIDDEGKLQRETAGWTEVAKSVGGNALPVLGGVAGSFASPVVAGTLAAGGKAYTKLIGQSLGDDQSAVGNAVDLGMEFGLNYAGAKIGDVFAKRAVNRGVATDLSRYNADQTADVIARARSMGIEVTPAEASNLQSLINQQKRYGEGMDEAGDIIRRFYERRSGQEDEAINAFIGRTPHAAVANRNTHEVATQAIDDAVAARSSAAGPIYRTGVRDDILVPDEVYARMTEDPVLGPHIQRLMTNPEEGLIDVNPQSTRFLDALKKSLDARAQQLGRNEQNQYQAGVVGDAARRLRTMTDDIFPVYGQARGAYASQSGEVDDVVNNIEGVISRIRNPEISKSLPRMIFEPSTATPESITRLRRHFIAQGREGDWNDVLNVYLRNAWETQKGAITSDFSRPGKWRKVVYGSQRARDNMRAAMGRSRFNSFEDLMDVLEATSRVPKGQSMTEPAGQAAAREAFEAAPILSSAKGFGMGGLREYWVNAKVDAWRADIARVMTNERSLTTLQQLRQLRSLNPRSERAIRVVSTALTQAGVGLGSEQLEVPVTRLPQLPAQSAPPPQ